MANIDTGQALDLLKARLNRAPGTTTARVSPLDDYFEQRIVAAIRALEATGIVLTDSAADLMLVVDYAAWEYSNRDKPGGMPDWLRLRRRERWLNQREVTPDDP